MGYWLYPGMQCTFLLPITALGVRPSTCNYTMEKRFGQYEGGRYTETDTTSLLESGLCQRLPTDDSGTPLTERSVIKYAPENLCQLNPSVSLPSQIFLQTNGALLRQE